MHIREFIETSYPEYYSIESYPLQSTVPFSKINEEWGVFSNFAHTPIILCGVEFDTVERLFQVMKFSNLIARQAVFEKKGNPKMTAKHYEKLCNVRDDWGENIVDAMKFCLALKYRQNEIFRNVLKKSAGLYIVEDQSSFHKKTADTWGAKLDAEKKAFVGPNLMGRLLMEIRDNEGILKYSLPDDYLFFSDLI